MIVIIDYGQAGNMHAIKNMLRKIGFDSIISSDINEIQIAEKLILPGVGAFDSAMEAIQKNQLIDILNKKVVDEKTPILGICLGMQIMTKSSEEGKLNGLGWVDAEILKFPLDVDHKKLRIPHLGWNSVSVNNDDKLFRGIEDPRFYFVHSYYCGINESIKIFGQSNYGIDFTSYFQYKNIIGVQFHPEKSHSFGKKLLTNFIKNF